MLENQISQVNRHVLYILKCHKILVLIFIIIIVSIKMRKKKQQWISYTIGGGQ